MNFCKPHWDRLRSAIFAKGLGDFVAQDGQEAIRRSVAQLENPDVVRLEDFDPLMAANNMIFSLALKARGLALMQPDPETGKPPCPLCVVAGPKDQGWIDGATAEVAKMVCELQKGPKNLKEDHG